MPIKTTSAARAARILRGETEPLRQPMPAPMARVIDFTLKPTTDEKKLNKTEAAWLEVLRRRGYDAIGVQNITLKLGADLRYTPDFSAVVNGRLVFFEVKGFMRDDARVKVLAAARLFRYADFVLVTKEKGQWIEAEIRA